MKPLEMKRPALPRELYRPTVFGFVTYFIHTFAWFFVFGYVSILIVESSLPTVVKVLLLIPSVVCSGHGFHMIGWFSHDGMHLSLIRNKYWSVIVGVITAGVALFPSLGYAITHWNHHRYTNQVSDPDAKIYPQYKTFWRRFFLGRVKANRGYFRNTVLVALNKPIDKGYRMPFSDGWTRVFAILTLVSVAIWLAIYAVFAYMYPLYFVLCVFLPYLTAIPATGLRIYLEHNNTGPGIFVDSRSYTSPWWTAIMFGNNFHLEHHLYPTIPAYHLPKVHRIVAETGVYEECNAHVVAGFWAPLKFLSGKYQYSNPELTDLEADPFAPTY